MDNTPLSGETALMTLAEVAAYLKVAEKTVSRMLQRGQIPAVKVANQWRFSRSTLNEWLMTGMRSVAPEALDELRPATGTPRSLSRLLPECCILMGLAPQSKLDLFESMTVALVEAGLVVQAEQFVEQLLEREELLTTAVGCGIALPHTREPAAVPGRFGICIGLIPEGMEFDAPDGLPVTLAVLVCADSVPRHLDMMVQVAQALHEDQVVRALRDAQAPRDVLAALIEHDQRRLFGTLCHSGRHSPQEQN